MGAREKYSASPFASVTTLTTDGRAYSAGSSPGSAAVDMRTSGSVTSGTATASMTEGSISGSSPCRLMKISSSIPRAASATRSVPDAQSGEVMTASPPNPRTTDAIRSSSVATTTREGTFARLALSQTYHIIGRPSISASGLPGSRVAP